MGCLRVLFSCFKSSGPSERTKRREEKSWGRALETHRRRSDIDLSEQDAGSATNRFYNELSPQEKREYSHQAWNGPGKYPLRQQWWQTEEAGAIRQQMQAEQIQQAKQALHGRMGSAGPPPPRHESKGQGRRGHKYRCRNVAT